MRSRFAAFALGLGEYLVDTLAEAHPDRALPRAELVRALSRAKDTQRFLGLRIVEAAGAAPRAAQRRSEPMATWADYKQTMIEPETLWLAAKRNDVRAILRLLDGGAEIDERDARGYTALMLAAYAGNVEAFDALLARGADVESPDGAGNTVLMGCAFKGHVALARRLIARGARLDAKNDAGLDARGFAQTFARTEIVALLDEAKTQP